MAKTKRPRPDFAMVRLAPAGVEMAGKAGTVGLANARRHFHFVAGVAQEVERSYEWNAVLRPQRYKGEPIFEEVTEDEQAAKDGE
jgi:hypothetical protein